MTANVVKLGQIATIDISNVDKKSKVGEAEVRLCNFVDVYHNWAITGNISKGFMIATANENQVVRFSVKKGMIAITKDSETRNDIGIPTYFADDFTDVVLGYHCALIKPDETILEGKYLNVVLHTEYAKRYFEANASGSGQRYTLTNEIIAGFPVPLPTIEEQRKIGNLFSTIDKKIENNNAICADLEGMAKLLYDYWFVQFDFPDENGKPYKSSGGKMVWNEELKREIPEGWEVDRLGKVCDTLLGGTPDTENALYWNGDIPWLNSGEVATSPVLNAEKTITKEGLKNSATSFASTGAVVMSITRYIRPSILGIDACFNQSVIAVIPNEQIHSTYLYMFMLSQVERYMRLRTGAQQPHINKETVDSTLITLPVDSVLNQFYDRVEPLFERQMIAMKEAKELESLRDFLLPILMNGQVKVKGA